MLIMIFVLSSAISVGGIFLGGFAGGVLTGTAATVAIGSVAAAIVRRFVARRVQSTASEIAQALGPQGEAILSRITNK
jgi:hypothetical protein